MDELADLLGESPAIKAVREKLRHLLERQPAGRRLPAILIQGETGTGKGLVARIVHRAGPRRRGPFVDINCAAIPETLLEAELFGFERGAFTDARRAKPGLFQTAHRRHALPRRGRPLARVGSRPSSSPSSRSASCAGSAAPEPSAVDVCIISATNTDLQAALRARRFREDLYHRLAVITLDLPAAAGTRARRAPPRGAVPRPSLRRLRAAAEDPGRPGAGPAARLSLARQYPRARQRDGACRALRRRSRDHRSDAGAAGGGGASASGPGAQRESRRRHAGGGDASASPGGAGAKRGEHLARGGPAGHCAQHAVCPP